MYCVLSLVRSSLAFQVVLIDEIFVYSKSGDLCWFVRIHSFHACKAKPGTRCCCDAEPEKVSAHDLRIWEVYSSTKANDRWEVVKRTINFASYMMAEFLAGEDSRSTIKSTYPSFILLIDLTDFNIPINLDSIPFIGLCFDEWFMVKNLFIHPMQMK